MREYTFPILLINNTIACRHGAIRTAISIPRTVEYLGRQGVVDRGHGDAEAEEGSTNQCNRQNTPDAQ